METSVALSRQGQDIESSLTISVSSNHTPLHESQRDSDPNETVRWGFAISIDDMRKAANGTSNYRVPLVAGVSADALARVQHSRTRSMWFPIDRLP